MTIYKDFGKWLLITFLVSIFCGLSSAIFLFILEILEKTRSENLGFYYILPFFGVLIVYAYNKVNPDSQDGNNLVISEIYQPKKILSKWMSPLVFGATLLTHLGGGSAGREGTAIQMGASLADLLNKPFLLSEDDRKRLLKIGVAGGFSAVFGTPVAGSIFVFEVLRQKERNLLDILFISLCAFTSNFICHLTKVQHADYNFIAVFPLSAYHLLWLFFSAVLFGLVALVFIYFAEFFKSQFSKIFPNPYFRIFFGGSIISSFFISTELYHLSGLGIPTLLSVFSEPTRNLDFFLKLILTTFTLGVGFKGGEVTPLFFIGATFASFLSFFIPLPLTFLVSCGFVSVFGAATKTPYASSILGAEIFGWNYLFIFLISCIIANYVSGNYSIYNTQLKHKTCY
jgi:H+/Cl- antiporter ClcA